MNKSEQINELAGALAKAQGAFENPKRNREVTVTTRTGANYKFAYATFDEIMNCIRKPLSDNGLAVSQGVDGASITTMLMHASGQWLSTELPIKGQEAQNAAQAMGSAITYAKRYALTAMLGIASEEDDDGNNADGNGIDSTRDRQPKQNGSGKTGNGTPPKQNGGTQAIGPDPFNKKGADEMWVDQQIAKLKSEAKSRQGVTDWWKANVKAINKLEATNPALHQSFMDVIDDIRNSLPDITRAA